VSSPANPRATLPVVLVDDEPSVLLSASTLLRSAGIRRVLTVQDSRTLLALLHGQPAAAVVLDLFMPHVSGQQLLPELVRAFPETPVVVMTAAQEVDTAVACMKEGAFDYLVKPVEESRFVSAVRRALEVRALRQQVGALKRYLLTDELEHPEAFSAVVAASRKMRALFQYVEAVAPSGEPVLITGETGVGKELLAETIHRLSGRSGNLVPVNVAGLDDTLFSDTLFGHRKGAYTGAADAREGLVAQAGGGTLFLDEIGDLSMAAQVKLLRLIQDQAYFPIGSDVARNSDVRVICATNRDLRRRIADGQFREDLYFRLSVHQMHMAPLRERAEDIPLLLAHFLDAAAQDLGKETPAVPPELHTLLGNYHFPGNVRELRAMVYDALALHRAGPVLATARFKALIQQQRGIGETIQTPAAEAQLIHIPARFPTLREAEAELMRQALARASQNQGVAAVLLGISRPALNRRLAQLKGRDK
jgi:DNA-binding NtrC family response regulator